MYQTHSFRCIIAILAGGRLDIKMLSYQYRNSHYKDKIVSWPSYLYNENPHSWNDRLYIETGSIFPKWHYVVYLHNQYIKLNKKSDTVLNGMLYYACDVVTPISSQKAMRNMIIPVIWHCSFCFGKLFNPLWLDQINRHLPVNIVAVELIV